MSREEMEKYFKEYFDIIPLYPDVQMIFEDGGRFFLILHEDKTDRFCPDDYTWEDVIREYENGCLFGLEKLEEEKNNDWKNLCM